eukprot:TRINITY_DN21282_c0_g1_i2.p1 TRINITY_DN21282_c0_g1~~TRINITY_DN21282_c0_g1_i2.p1  ORF type:complete len:345 (+),score=66.11 TRINITY_DN21282_c0_g1_i2:99-1037(+)
MSDGGADAATLRAPWDVETWDASLIAESVRIHGLCHVRAPVLPADGGAEHGLDALRAAAVSRFQEVLRAVEERKAEGHTDLNFREAVRRDGGRWDIWHGMADEPFATLVASPPWGGALDALFGPSHRLLFSGLVVATGASEPTLTPGASAAACSSGLVPLRPQQVPPGLPEESWLTAGAPALARSSGKYYHEVVIGRGMCSGEPQVGWLTEEFVPGPFDGDGVGDDACGWAADGVRCAAWHDGPAGDAPWPRRWRDGDVVGCAVDIDEGRMSFSLCGDWAAGLEMHFDARGGEHPRPVRVERSAIGLAIRAT